MGGKFHLKLNMGERPIANKYREGKMKRTLKRELKVLEIVKREALGTSDCFSTNQSIIIRLLRFKRGVLGGFLWVSTDHLLSVHLVDKRVNIIRGSGRMVIER